MSLRESNRRMTLLLQALAVKEGTHPTVLNGVKLMRISKSIPRRPVLYESGIVIVGQGRKFAYIADGVYVYDANNYLVLSVPLPFECETEANPQRPLLAMQVAVDLATLGELLMKMQSSRQAEQPSAPSAIYSTTLEPQLSDTAVRLLESLQDPVEAQVLGPGIVRELIYRVLCGKQGAALRTAAAICGSLGQVSRTLERMHAEYARYLNVKDLAAAAGMSASTFHQTFKIVTSTSPLQYLKTIRLHKARLLMAYEGVRAGVAAERVGYESASQFSREFKRLFGVCPVEDAARARSQLEIKFLSATRYEA